MGLLERHDSSSSHGLEQPLLSASPSDVASNTTITVAVERKSEVPATAAAAAASPAGSELDVEEVAPALSQHHRGSCHWLQTTSALLALQLGWGLWLFPNDFARLGWIPALCCLALLALLTSYSGTLFTRLYNAVPGAVLFGDLGQAAAGRLGRSLVYAIIYSLDATRCVILHLAATQSLRHVFPVDERPPLWQCGLAVLVVAVVLVQVRSLGELSWVFMAGTSSQLIAIGIVLYQLVSHPNPHAKRAEVAVNADNLPAAVVAVMNMIFAFGGQFAFVEIMGSMKQPRHFPRAVLVCTVAMALLYGGLGAVGYWSLGDSITGIVIFNLGDGNLIRLAAAFILLQALAQYLVNLNVWTHNLLVLMTRWQRGHDHEPVHCPSRHCWKRWMVTSAVVVAYSYGLCITIPYFTTLVGLVTSVTYLVCAYTLPAWFTLKLMASKINSLERLFLWSLIPLSLAVSALGLWSSVISLISDLGGGGESGWSTAPGSTNLGAAVMSAVKMVLPGSK